MTDKILPPKLPYFTNGYILGEKFSFRDRLRILFGGRVLVHCVMLSQHKPGQKTITSRLYISNEETLETAVREHERTVRAELEDKKAPSVI